MLQVQDHTRLEICERALACPVLSIPFLLTGPRAFGYRTRRMSNPRSTRKGSTSSSATSSSTCNSRGRPCILGATPAVHTHTQSLAHTSAFLANHIFDLLGIAFFLTCDGTITITAPDPHKQHSSNLALASLHPHVDTEFSPHSHTIPFNHYPPPIIVPHH